MNYPHRVGEEEGDVIFENDENPVNLVITSDVDIDPNDWLNTRFEYSNLKTGITSWTSIESAQQSIHPMFRQRYWKQILAVLATMAFEDQFFIRFNVGIGEHYQYVLIYDDAYLVEPTEIRSKHEGPHIGALFSRITCAQRSQNMWMYEFDQRIEEDEQLIGNDAMYNGVKVKMIFRKNYSDFLMPFIG